MDKLYYFLLAAIALLLLAAKDYTPPPITALERHCHPEISLCVYCTHFPQQYSNKKAYILSEGQFAVLSSRKGIIFKKELCRDFLNAVDSSFSWNYNEYLQKQYQNGEVKLRKVLFPLGDTYFDSVQNVGDTVIFSRDQGSIQPKLSFQSKTNQQIQLKYARIMGWSIFWTIFIIAIVHKLSFNIFQVHISSFPFMELTSLAYGLFYSYDWQFFEVDQVVKAMTLAIIGLKLYPYLENKKLWIAAWLIISIISVKIIIFGQMILVVCLYRNFKKKINQKKAVTIIVSIDLGLVIVSNILSIGILYNLAILWKVIMLPTSLLIIKTYKQQTNRK